MFRKDSPVMGGPLGDGLWGGRGGGGVGIQKWKIGPKKVVLQQISFCSHSEIFVRARGGGGNTHAQKHIRWTALSGIQRLGAGLATGDHCVPKWKPMAFLNHKPPHHINSISLYFEQFSVLHFADFLFIFVIIDDVAVLDRDSLRHLTQNTTPHMLQRCQSRSLRQTYHAV